jgi:hypothetical protein
MLGFVLRCGIALVAALLIYLIGAAMIRKLKVDPEPEPDPADVRPLDLRFRCVVCGAEVVMTAAQDDDPEPPRHCREDMVEVEEADSAGR